MKIESEHTIKMSRTETRILKTILGLTYRLCDSAIRDSNGKSKQDHTHGILAEHGIETYGDVSELQEFSDRLQDEL